MTNYPEQIEEVFLRRHALSQRIAQLHEALGGIQGLTYALKHSEKDEAGKPVWPNEQLREIAVIQALSANERWLNLKSVLADAENEQSILTARLERLRGEFALHKLERREQIADGYSAEITRIEDSE